MTTTSTSLQDMRDSAADRAFQHHDFGDGVAVKDCDGWEYTTPGNSMSRAVYIEPVEADDAASSDGQDEPSSERVTFTVVFGGMDSAKLANAYALNNSGNHVGRSMEALGLNPQQKRFLEVYSGGEFAYLGEINALAECMDEIDKCGDPMVRLFLVEFEGCLDMDEAVSRIEEVQRLVLALAAAFPESASDAVTSRARHKGG